ncbi:MAG: glucosamine-6-phosphate deaminase [Candidatus Lokiarchaeota archaeon]|nr:glucosamine-6-phosphate deaminase [Candidatus Lokiarchaeota archaeon]
MKIIISKNKEENGRVAAEKATEILKKILNSQDNLRFVAATGASQFEFLNHLTKIRGIDWERMEMFHLDEYIGLSPDHPASFRNYLQKRIVNKVNLGKEHFIKGERKDPRDECKRLNKLILKSPIDISFIGIGENGHIAFNDPPANFETEKPYIIVDLDEKCRNQQVNEGWFKDLNDVPKQAISMSVKQIMKSDYIICIVPEKRKAIAVQNCLSEDAKISPEYPASILKKHQKCYIFLDEGSASLL